MAGLCGTVGGQHSDIEGMRDGLCYHGEENSTTYENDRISVGYVDHPFLYGEQPVSMKNGEVLLWIWGTILGHEYDGEYEKHSGDLTRVEYCAELYDTYGETFPSGLNSEFSGVIYNRNEDTVSIFTDRLSSRPVYYAYTNDGTLVFSSLLQSLYEHPHVSFEYDEDYLSQFFAYSRSLGTSTPVQGVKILPPASITKFDLDGNRLECQTYWSPKVQPLDDSFSEIADRFQSVFTEAVQDRASGSDKKDGLLLSGGSDSRAILAAYESDLMAFHMNELFDNPEAQIAKQIAETGGAKYRFLQRNEDYHSQVLEECSSIMNFNGLYHSAKAVGFRERLTDEVDTLFCGQYGDTIIGDTYVPMQSAGKSMNIESIEEYIKEFDQGSMGGYLGELQFTDGLPRSPDTLSSNITKTNEGIISHGVRYPSWKSLVEFGSIYPITNVRTFINYETLIQMGPTHYPYLDNRLIDLILQTPSEYRYDADLVDETVYQLDPDLASIPHANTGFPLSNASLTQKYQNRIKSNKYINHLLTTPVREIPTDFLDYIGLIEKTSRSDFSKTHVSDSSWINKPGVIRAHPFVENKLHEHQKVLNKTPFISKDAAWNSYQEHLDGENNSYEIFCLLTFLEITSNIIQRDYTASRKPP